MRNFSLFLLSAITMSIITQSCKKKTHLNTPTVSFTFNVSNLSVVFISFITNAELFSWDFGDGQISGVKVGQSVCSAFWAYEKQYVHDIDTLYMVTGKYPGFLASEYSDGNLPTVDQLKAANVRIIEYNLQR